MNDDHGAQQTVETLKEMGTPDHCTCLLQSLYASSDLKIGLVGVFSVVLLAALFWIFSERELNHHSK